MHHLTTVLETIPKPLIAKAQTALGKQKKKKQKNTAKNDFQYGGWNSSTQQCGMWLWDHDTEFAR